MEETNMMNKTVEAIMNGQEVSTQDHLRTIFKAILSLPSC